jgi:hypothetical protein
MSDFSNAGKATCLGALRTAIDQLSIHTANPGTTGANEVTGGSYARIAAEAADWSAVSGGEFTLLADVEFDGPAGADARFFGYWASTVYQGKGTITGDIKFNASGKFILQAGTKIDLNLVCE